VTVSVGRVDVTVEPPMVALIVVAVPDTAPVKVAVYVPFELSVTAEKFPVDVPPTLLNKTVKPPPGSWLLLASFAVRVTVTFAPDWTVPAERETIEFEREAAPGVTVIVGIVEVTAAAFIVAASVVAVPAVDPVKTTVYVPLLLSTTEPKLPFEVPPDFETTTVSPPLVSGFAFASFAVTVTVEVAPDWIEAALTETVDCASERAPGVTATVGSVEVTAEPPIVPLIVVAVPAVVPVNVAV
jgi:hypothetical protein